MSFALVTTTITQSGTDANLSGIVGNGGTVVAVTTGSPITPKNVYNIASNRLVITGTLTITPEKECLYQNFIASGIAISVSSGGILIIGTKVYGNGAFKFSNEIALWLGHKLDYFSESSAALRIITGGTLRWYGGQIRAQAAIHFGGTVLIDSPECVLIAGGVSDNSYNPEIRQYSTSLTINGLTVYGMGLTFLQNPLKMSNTKFIACPEGILLSSSSSSANTWYTAKNISLGGSPKDVVYWYDRWVRIINANIGSALISRERSTTPATDDTGLHEIREEVIISAKDDAGAVVSVFGHYLTDTNNGSRLAASQIGTNPDYTANREYAAIANQNLIDKLTEPVTVPTGIGNGAAITLDGKYAAVAHSTTPFVSIYKRTSDSWLKLANPGTLPVTLGVCAAWSVDMLTLAVGCTGSPYLRIYYRATITTDTFSLATLTTNPVGAVYGVSFSEDGVYLAIATQTTPYAEVYKRSGNTFTKVSALVALPGLGNACSFSSDNLYVAYAHAGSPYVTVYKRSSDTFTKVAAITALAGIGRSVSFARSTNYVAVGHTTTPFVSILSRSGDTFTKIGNPASLPEGQVNGVEYSYDEKYLFCALSIFPFYAHYSFVTTTYTKLPVPDYEPDGVGYGVATSQDGIYQICSHDIVPYAKFYKRNWNALSVTDGGVLTAVHWCNVYTSQNMDKRGLTNTSDDLFNIRVRSYGKYMQTLNNQVLKGLRGYRYDVGFRTNPDVSLSEAVAAAITGITLTDHGGSPVSWNGKSWGITITGNLTTNPSLTASGIFHYLEAHLARTSTTFNGKLGGAWHGMVKVAGEKFDTERGTYYGVQKGVRVVDQAGTVFIGFDRMQADDGTYYVAPKRFTFTINPTFTGFEWRLYSVTALGSLDGAVELAGAESAGSIPIIYSYIYSSDTNVALQIISQPGHDYVESISYFVLSNADQSNTILLSKDNNN